MQTGHRHSAEKAVADVIRQLIFGLGHGMISILGLTIGVAFATHSSKIVVISGLVGMLTGLATLAAMEYLSAKTQKEIYDNLVEKERKEYEESPDIEREEMIRYYTNEGFSEEEAALFVKRLRSNRDRWLKAHITHILEFIPSKTGNPAKESAILGGSHVLGSVTTLLPYLLIASLTSAAYTSIIFTATLLFVVGSLKTRVTARKWYVSGGEFLLLGMTALVVGYIAGSLLSGLVQ